MKALLILALALGPDVAFADPAPLPSVAPSLDKVAGVYKHHFANGDISGDTYTSEDIFELVKVSPKTAYFRIHGEFYNGHECNISGIADLMADALTYYGPVNFDKQPCVLKFTVNGKGVILNDVNGACQQLDCGARGSFGYGDSVTYPFAWRRSIKYMARLQASTEYRDALKEHDAHKPGTPAPDG